MGTLNDFLNNGVPIGINSNTDLSFLLNGVLPSNSAYAHTDHSYSGCDIRAIVTDSRTGSSKIIGNLATISYSIHREVMPVRSLGRTYPKAFTRGQRTIAGTLVFTIFDRYALYDVASVKSKYDRGVGESAHSLLGDQMAPFDVYCMFQNELGDVSQLNIYGIQLIDEGQVMSINDIFTESTHSYVAQDIDVMFPHSLGPIEEAPALLNPNSIFRFDTAANTALPDKAPDPTRQDYVVPGQ
jgi:hypothetical protein